MIDSEIPLDQLPRYVHPESGAPWFRCPACGSDHVRPVELFTQTFAMNATVVAGGAPSYCPVPGADRALDLAYPRGSPRRAARTRSGPTTSRAATTR
jgi:hypothetical protein